MILCIIKSITSNVATVVPILFIDIVSSLYMHIFAGTPGCGITDGESLSM